MDFYRRLSDSQRFGDLAVGLAQYDEVQDFPFPCREGLRRACGRRSHARRTRIGEDPTRGGIARCSAEGSEKRPHAGPTTLHEVEFGSP